VTIDRIDGPSFTASRITGALRSANVTTLDLQIAAVTIAGNTWRNVRAACPDLRQQREQLVCTQGTLETPAKIPLSFRYSTLTKDLDLALKPAAGEDWRLTLESHASTRTLTLAVNNAVVTRFNTWWPSNWPKPNAGSVSGKLIFNDARDASGTADLTFANLGFSDASGLHAGEKISAVVSLQAQQRGDPWQWRSRIEWKNGDVLWQPLFLSGGGHVLDAAGAWDAKRLTVERGTLALAGIGNLEFSATLDPRARTARGGKRQKRQSRNHGAL